MRMKASTKRCITYAVFSGIVVILILYHTVPCDSVPRTIMVPRDAQKFIFDRTSRQIPYDRNMPIIFIGGMPRSGTTLMRAMLDAHPEIRCGEETRVIPRLLGMKANWEKSNLEKKRLNEAGITGDVLDSAMASFILEIVAKHGEAAPHLCNKDPFTLKTSVYLSHLFPNAKFLLMIRDGRATVNSIISRQVTITGFDLKNFRNCMTKWNSAMEVMFSQCVHVGPDNCMPVYYEQLVLQPELWLRRILTFLDIHWNSSVLHHEDFIEKPGGIAVSKTEKSTDQIIKPVNLEALSKWVGKIPQDVVKDMASIAPMLKTLGYDPEANPPDYGKPDPRVANNTLHIQQNLEYWKQREGEILKANGSKGD